MTRLLASAANSAIWRPMVAAARRPLAREILALALCSVVFLAAVATSRLQGMLLAGKTANIGALCLPSGEPADTPDSSDQRHRHCVLCVVAATDCGSPQVETLIRLAFHAQHGGDWTADRDSAPARAYQARGPPAQA